MKDGIKLVLRGIALGIAGAIVLTRLMVSLLFEVKPTDPADSDGGSSIARGSGRSGMLHTSTARLEHSSRHRLALRIVDQKCGYYPLTSMAIRPLVETPCHRSCGSAKQKPRACEAFGLEFRDAYLKAAMAEGSSSLMSKTV